MENYDDEMPDSKNQETEYSRMCESIKSECRISKCVSVRGRCVKGQ